LAYKYVLANLTTIILKNKCCQLIFCGLRKKPTFVLTLNPLQIMASDAVGSERVSTVVGYKITKGDFSTTSPNLPQRIAVFAEANAANQATLDTDPWEATTAQAAGTRYGFGSPIYALMRILRPFNSDGVGGIPVFIYPQEETVSATSIILEVTPTGVATGNGTHTLKIAGRFGLDGTNYDINIVEGDTTDDITAKIADAVNNVLGCPVSAYDTGYETWLESKWKGLTAAGISASVDTNDTDLGITYAVTQQQAASGTPSIADGLAAFGNEWNTIVINSYGTVSSIMTALEQFNGIPDPTNPTGRYAGIIMKPFIALTGSVADDPSSITDTRLNDVTIAICPAPLSLGLPMEAAANMCVLFARCTQDTPNLDVQNRYYPDMPVPDSIGTMASYTERDRIVKKGCSTVDLNAGRYQVKDFVTTYHPLGENPPQFRYCRNLMIDFNIRFRYYLLEQTNVINHSISADADVVSATNVIKPKQWKAILNSNLAENLGKDGLIADVPFMQDSIEVNISTTNPDRLETFFRYNRSGFARIASTTAEAGFNFGTN
jgi:phage tail sheath gpL-like